MTARVLTCLLVVAVACHAAQPLHFPKKIKSEWELWRKAFDKVADGDGVVTRDAIRTVFKEHFKLMHRSLPGHEHHTHINEEDEQLFRGEAEQFSVYLTSAGVQDASLSWSGFKQQVRGRATNARVVFTSRPGALPSGRTALPAPAISSCPSLHTRASCAPVASSTTTWTRGPTHRPG